ncbi:MarR family transcriptional regulator [Puteibacter caeruleilacunae]|nr:MarR family transcriptional regulator [Puteibacter caeruleilacunae]
MSDKRQELLNAYQKLMSVKGECTSKVCDLYSVSEMTINQIGYLKIIDRNDKMTFTELAEKTNITKPSVTNLITKLIDFGCVYKERCSNDKRVSYIKLTEKGTNIARHENTAVKNLIDRMMKSLSNEEIDQLIKIFNKVL